MPGAIRSRAFTLSPTKANKQRLTDAKLKLIQLHDQATKIQEEAEGIIAQIEKIKSLLD